MLKLVINPDTEFAWTYPLPPGTQIVGSDPGATTLLIQHPSVAAKHCEITVEAGSAYVTDLGSGIGLLVENQPASEALLNVGQTLRLGDVILRLEAAQETGPATASHSPAPASTDHPSPTTTLGNMQCRYHPKSAAVHYCAQCQKGYCSLCVSQRSAGCYCRSCGGACQALEVQAVEEVPELSFYQQIASTFAYPFKGNGVWMMGIGSIVFVLADFGSRFSILVWILLVGYAALYAQGILQASAQGDGRGPTWPDTAGDMRGALAGACLQYIATCAFCFLPAILLMLFADKEQLWVAITLLASILVGFLYLPMALLAVGILDTVGAVNPMVVAPAIGRCLAPYTILLLMLGLVAGISAGLDWLLETLIPVPFLPGVVSSLFSLYFLTVFVRLMGVFYYSNRHRIGWLGHAG